MLTNFRQNYVQRQERIQRQEKLQIIAMCLKDLVDLNLLRQWCLVIMRFLFILH